MQRIAAFEAFEVLKQMKMKETSSNSGVRNLSQLCFWDGECERLQSPTVMVCWKRFLGISDCFIHSHQNLIFVVWDKGEWVSVVSISPVKFLKVRTWSWSEKSIQYFYALERRKWDPRLFPDASLVRASARESRSATQVAPLEISDSWAVRPRTRCCCQQ